MSQCYRYPVGRSKYLRKAADFLRHDVINRIWVRVCRRYPVVCIIKGMFVNFNAPYELHVEQQARQMLSCTRPVMAFPCYLFHYLQRLANKSDTPHHCAGMTIVKNIEKKEAVVSFFDPRGTQQRRTEEMQKILNVWKSVLHEQGFQTVYTHLYTQQNLQDDDRIGLCQLFSLFFLTYFIQSTASLNLEQMQQLNPNYIIHQLTDPNGWKIHGKHLYHFYEEFIRPLMNGHDDAEKDRLFQSVLRFLFKKDENAIIEIQQ